MVERSYLRSYMMRGIFLMNLKLTIHFGFTISGMHTKSSTVTAT